ncbi:MAG: hypothetical protein J7K62_00125 [Thermoplasmata archaeon]|nr:hypothetical protein [Thermoplasmata archaeon]
MNKKFECLRCALCCKNTNFSNVNLNQEIIGEKLAKKGLYLGAKNSEIGILLFNDEFKKLRRFADENGIKFHPVPLFFVIDKLSENAFIFCWTLGHKVCPFLEKNDDHICLVEDFKPLVCKAFPIIKNVRGTKIRYLPSGKCPGVLKVENQEIDFTSFYENELEAAKTVDKKMQEIFSRFSRLKDKKLIEPVSHIKPNNAIRFLKDCIVSKKICFIEEINIS